MSLEKKMLSLEDIEAQTALELPDREMMALITLVAFDVVDVNNNQVAVGAQIPVNACDVDVNVLSPVTDTSTGDTTCENTATQDVQTGRR